MYLAVMVSPVRGAARSGSLKQSAPLADSLVPETLRITISYFGRDSVVRAAAIWKVPAFFSKELAHN
jgi:hypothetical protein